jgi:hypothetical protein
MGGVVPLYTRPPRFLIESTILCDTLPLIGAGKLSPVGWVSLLFLQEYKEAMQVKAITKREVITYIFIQEKYLHGKIIFAVPVYKYAICSSCKKLNPEA